MINFPNVPSQGQVFTSTTGLKYVYLDGVWRIVEAPQDIGKAEARNRIVNGAMQISQENGNIAGAVNAYHPADQWRMDLSTAGTMWAQRVQSVTPNGSKDRFRVNVTVADAALAAGDVLIMTQNIEGVRVADFRWGTASAKQIVVRFGWRSPAGTYTFSIVNNAANRSYLVNFTVSAGQANIDTEQIIVIPGDTTGVWPTDTTRAMLINFAVAAGTTLQGVAGWNTGFFYGTAANTNGMATINNTFELFDVGLYLDPLNTGIAPPWQMPDEAEELRACQRYWQTYTLVMDTAGQYLGWAYPVLFRVPPAIVGGNVGFTNAINSTNIFGCFQNTREIRGMNFNARM